MRCKCNLLEGDRNATFSRHQAVQYELAPVPVSMFADNGEMRIAETNATIKKNIQVETPPRLTPQVDVAIIDGCAILWVIHWPNTGTVRDFVDSFTSFIFGKVEMCDIYTWYSTGTMILASIAEHDLLELANRLADATS